MICATGNERGHSTRHPNGMSLWEANAPSSATRPTGGVDCNRDAMAELNAVKG